MYRAAARHGRRGRQTGKRKGEWRLMFGCVGDLSLFREEWRVEALKILSSNASEHWLL